MGVLPFFHSFGYTVSIWGTLSLGFSAAYHFSPLDARVIGNLCQEHKATILLCTPTFLLGYLKRCDAEQFASMRLPILGAEKLKPEVADRRSGRRSRSSRWKATAAPSFPRWWR